MDTTLMAEIFVSSSQLQRELVPQETMQDLLEEKANHLKFFSLDNSATILPSNPYKKLLLALEHLVSASELFKEKMDSAEVSDMLNLTPLKKLKKLSNVTVTISMVATSNSTLPRINAVAAVVAEEDLVVVVEAVVEAVVEVAVEDSVTEEDVEDLVETEEAVVEEVVEVDLAVIVVDAEDLVVAEEVASEEEEAIPDFLAKRPLFLNPK